jgi:hypothetical protein
MKEKQILTMLKWKSSCHLINSIYFNPATGKFLFDDKPIDTDLAQTWIKNKVIVFSGYVDYRFDKIIRYSLA